MNQSERESHLGRLRNYNPPKSFSKRSAAKTTIEKLRRGEGVLSVQESKQLEDLGNLLATAAFGLAAEDEITLGMIKPRANEGIGLSNNDDGAAGAIMATIGLENIALVFHTLINRTQAENFYGEQTLARLQQISTGIPGLTVAESHLAFITSGPISVILISRSEGNAAGWWREKMGSTRPSQAHPDSIRGKHATDSMMPNNLVHGSATPQEAITEIAAFQSIINDLIKLGDQTLSD